MRRNRSASKRAPVGLIAWGAYDETKPRVRLLLKELRKTNALAAEISFPIWAGIRDKAVAGRRRLIRAGSRLLFAYPKALAQLAKQPGRSAILLPYPAIPDIFFAWPVAKIRLHKLIFDAFIPLYDTMVEDRALARRDGIMAKGLWALEWAALRLADIILVDTDQHGDFYSREFRIARDRFQTVLVGAEPLFWKARSGTKSKVEEVQTSSRDSVVLFYGQLIPLHGLETILEAVRLTSDEAIHWLLIGSGQEEAKVRDFIAAYPSGKVRWIPWVAYEQLPGIIASSAVALGVFGTSDKAARVIPNKMFQVLAAGKAVVTRASPAVDPIAARYPEAVITTPAGDGAALADAVRKALQNPGKLGAVPPETEAELGPAKGVQALLERLSTAG